MYIQACLPSDFFPAIHFSPRTRPISIKALFDQSISPFNRVFFSRDAFFIKAHFDPGIYSAGNAKRPSPRANPPPPLPLLLSRLQREAEIVLMEEEGGGAGWGGGGGQDPSES